MALYPYTRRELRILICQSYYAPLDSFMPSDSCFFIARTGKSEKCYCTFLLHWAKTLHEFVKDFSQWPLQSSTTSSSYSNLHPGTSACCCWPSACSVCTADSVYIFWLCCTCRHISQFLVFVRTLDIVIYSQFLMFVLWLCILLLKIIWSVGHLPVILTVCEV
jgi:hypothetical protein